MSNRSTSPTRSCRSRKSSPSCVMRSTRASRSNKRPLTEDYLRLCFTDFIELHGDRAFREDAAIMGGWARLDGETVMVIGHQRGRDTKENLRRNFGMPHPEGYRKALRL